MVVLPGHVPFKLGSPPPEQGGVPEEQGKSLSATTITRSFAIASKAVTVEQFKRFRSTFNYNSVFANKPDCPINAVSWYDAVAYCNWLSEQEGINEKQRCYEPNAKGEYGPGMRAKDKYLTLSGYRLPTAAEWEYACRAGTVTSSYYGDGEELLGKYAWYTKDSQDRWLLTVGSLKPNDFGLFDMLGNAWQWCEDRSGTYLADNSTEDQQDIESISKDDFRTVRGGSFTYPAWNDCCSSRGKYLPTTQNNNIGFRLTRTVD
jgi:hypothetical protein